MMGTMAETYLTEEELAQVAIGKQEDLKLRQIALEYAMDFCLKSGQLGEVVPVADYFYQFLIGKISF